MPGRLTGGCGFTGGSRTGLPKSAPESMPTCNSAAPFRRVGRGRRGMATHTARMPHGSADQRKSAGQVNIYWRRRVIALVAGLGMLALVTWTVNGALGGGSTPRTTDLSQTTGHHSAPAAPGSASATPRPAAGSAGASATPSPTGNPTPTPSSSATQHATAKHRAPSGGQARPAGGGRGRLLRREPRPEPVLRPVQLPRARPSPVRRQRGVHRSRPMRGRPGSRPPACADQGGREDPGLGLRGLRQIRRAPGHDAGPGSTRGSPVHLEPDDLGPRLPPSAPGRPGGHRGNLSSRAMIFVLKGRGIAVP